VVKNFQKYKLTSIRLLLKFTTLLQNPFILVIIGVDLLVISYSTYYIDTYAINTLYGFFGSMVAYIVSLTYFYRLHSEVSSDINYLDQPNQCAFIERPSVAGAGGGVYPNYSQKLAIEINKVFNKHLVNTVLFLILAVIGILTSHLKIILK
jgi:hypothetical protein